MSGISNANRNNSLSFRVILCVIYELCRGRFICSNISTFHSNKGNSMRIFSSNRGPITSINIVIGNKEFRVIDIIVQSGNKKTHNLSLLHSRTSCLLLILTEVYVFSWSKWRKPY